MFENMSNLVWLVAMACAKRIGLANVMFPFSFITLRFFLVKALGKTRCMIPASQWIKLDTHWTKAATTSIPSTRVMTVP